MKFKKLFLCLVTMIIMTVGVTLVSYADDVSKAVTITPVEVTDINDTSTMTNWQHSIDCSKMQKKNNYNFYYKLELDSPAYIKINQYNNISPDPYDGGKCTIYLSRNGIFTNDFVNADGLWNRNFSYNALLESGTWYIAVKYEVGNTMTENPQSYFSVYTQKTPRTGNTNGATKDKAINVANGDTGEYVANGVFTNETYSAQWFKFTVNQKSDVSLSLSTINDINAIDRIFLYKNDTDVTNKYYWLTGARSSFNESYEGLEPGTYYYCVKGSGYKSPVKLTIKIEDKYAPSTPVTKSYKSGTKYIKGNAEIGSTVYAKIGKKTYKAVTDKYGVFTIKTPVLKVGNKISIFAKDQNGNKSSVSKLTVKNRKLTAPKIKTAKVNTKLVKGTAKKGTTVYVTYGGKTVKKKLTSNSFSVKISKKLTKGAKVKVKVVDSYGNYSKTVTYKIK